MQVFQWKFWIAICARRDSSIMDEFEIKSITLVGIGNGDNGRRCDKHHICGQSVKEGVIIRFLLTIVNRNDNMEYTIGAYRIDEAKTTCLVGFIPSKHVNDWKYYEDKIGQVVSIKNSTSSYGSCVVALIPLQIGIPCEKFPKRLPELGTRINVSFDFICFGQGRFDC